VFTKI